jgi:dynein light chain LC8-type
MQPEAITHEAPIKEDTHRVQIKNADMPEEMQQRAVELAKTAVGAQQTPREIAGAIKKAFDRVYGPAWHCIVGKAFGSFVTHGRRPF